MLLRVLHVLSLSVCPIHYHLCENDCVSYYVCLRLYDVYFCLFEPHWLKSFIWPYPGIISLINLLSVIVFCAQLNEQKMRWLGGFKYNYSIRFSFVLIRQHWSRIESFDKALYSVCDTNLSKACTDFLYSTNFVVRDTLVNQKNENVFFSSFSCYIWKL